MSFRRIRQHRRSTKWNRHWWPVRGRHPHDKGPADQRCWADLFRSLTNGRTWRRHREDFAASLRGARRRAERQFHQRQRAASFETGRDYREYDDGWYGLA